MRNVFAFFFVVISTYTYAQTPIKVKKENIGITAFSYVMTYDLTQVNSTREKVCSSKLNGNHYLDSCALVRCIRLAKILKSNPDKFITDNSYIFHIEAHNKATTAENAGECFYAACILKEDIINIKESDIPTLVTKGYGGLYISGNSYNQSEGHYKNRIDVKYKEYGSYYLVVFIYVKNYNPEGMLERIPTRITIHYELFK